jgi:hypothetical protein
VRLSDGPTDLRLVYGVRGRTATFEGSMERIDKYLFMYLCIEFSYQAVEGYETDDANQQWPCK